MCRSRTSSGKFLRADLISFSAQSRKEHFDFGQQKAHNLEGMGTEMDNLIKRVAAELKTVGAAEVYLFGSCARGNPETASDLDLAVTGLPPRIFYRVGARISDLAGRSVDLIDLDRD